MLHDLRIAARTLARTPGFTLSAALILGLGLGAGSTVFSAVDAVLFRPLQVRDPGRLVRVYSSTERHERLSSTSNPVLRDYSEQAKSFEALAGYSAEVPVNVSVPGGAPELAKAAVVSGTFFDVLGISAARGRLLSPEDDRSPGAHPVVVLGHGHALRRFGSLDAALGSELRINGQVYTVIGVAPASFWGADLDSFPEMWFPLSMAEKAMPGMAGLSLLSSRAIGWLDVIGRLKPGVSLAAAQAELDAIAKHRAAGQPARQRDPWAFLLPASDARIASDVLPASPVATASRLSWLLLGAAGLVLLLAGAVVAGLLTVRAERRREELAVRLAIGAPRGALVRQLLAEAVLLALPAAAIGLVAASWTGNLVAAVAPADLPIPLAASTPVLALRVAGVTALLALFISVAFGVFPALRASRADVAPALKGAARTSAPGRTFLGGAFVVFQVALSTVLLAAAGLLLRTLQKTTAVAPGFTVDGALVAQLDVARQGYSAEEGARRLEAVLREVRALPLVTSAGLARMVPVQRQGMRATVRIAGFVPKEETEESVDFNVATPGFLAAAGIPLRAGRDFTDADTKDGAPVVIVNEAFTRRYWPGQDALGKRVDDVGPQGASAEIVGIVRDVKLRSLREAPEPQLIVPHAQVYFPGMTLVVRMAGDPAAAVPALREAVARVDPDLPLFAPQTLRQHVGATLGKERFLAALLSAFSALALFLAAFGLFSLLTFTTETRRREIGIRMALGAERGAVVRLVVSQGARLAGAGLLAGLAAALALSRLLANLLFGIGAHDPLTFAGAGALLAGAALLASFLPAHRASRVEPMNALRAE